MLFEIGTSKKRKSRSKEEAAEEEEEEEEEEESSPRRRPSAPPPPAVVLPGLQRLRVLCSSGDPGSGVTGAPPERPGDTQSGASKRPRVQDDEGQHPATAVSGKNIADTMSNSSKLLVRCFHLYFVNYINSHFKMYIPGIYVCVHVNNIFLALLM